MEHYTNFEPTDEVPRSREGDWFIVLVKENKMASKKVHLHTSFVRYGKNGRPIVEHRDQFMAIPHGVLIVNLGGGHVKQGMTIVTGNEAGELAATQWPDTLPMHHYVLAARWPSGEWRFANTLDSNRREEIKSLVEYEVVSGGKNQGFIMTPVGRIYTDYSWGHQTSLTYYQMPTSGGRSQADWIELRHKRRFTLSRAELVEYLSRGKFYFVPREGISFDELKTWLVELGPETKSWSYAQRFHNWEQTLVFSATNKLGGRNKALLRGAANLGERKLVLARMGKLIGAIMDTHSSVYAFTCECCGGSPEEPSYTLAGYDHDLQVYERIPAWMAQEIEARLPGRTQQGDCGCHDCRPWEEEE